MRGAIALLLLLLAACSDGESPPLGVPSEIAVSGRVTFDLVPVDTAGATPLLDYAATIASPARGVLVELVLKDDSVYARDRTDDNGAYRLLAPELTTVRVRAIAQLGSAGDPEVQVTDAADRVYNVGVEILTDALDLGGVDLHAASGWNGVAYSGIRQAAPFAILDVISECRNRVLAVAPDTDFPLLQVIWSPSTGSSAFSAANGTITLLGIADTDTDEYDRHVIAHEWSHYWTHHFSVDDSLGGEHDDGDILDEALAYSEGLANGLAGVLLQDPIYADTLGAAQNGGFTLDLESDLHPATDTVTVATSSSLNTTASDIALRRDGVHSESSVAQLVWDIVDDASEVGDGVAIGWGALYAALTAQAYRDHPAVACITRLLVWFDDDTLYTLADAEAIGDGSDSGMTIREDAAHALGLRYASGDVTAMTPLDLTLDGAGRALATHDEFGTIAFASNAAHRLYHQQRFELTMVDAGIMRITVTPGSASIDPVFIQYGSVVTASQGNAGADDVINVGPLSAGATVVFSIATASGPGGFTVHAEHLPSG